MQLTPLTLLTFAGLAAALPASSSQGLPANTQSCKATQNAETWDGSIAALWYEVEIGVPYSKETCKTLEYWVIDQTVIEWYPAVSRTLWVNCKKTKAGQIKFQFDSGFHNHEYRINYALHQALPLIGFNCPGH